MSLGHVRDANKKTVVGLGHERSALELIFCGDAGQVSRPVQSRVSRWGIAVLLADAQTEGLTCAFGRIVECHVKVREPTSGELTSDFDAVVVDVDAVSGACRAPGS